MLKCNKTISFLCFWTWKYKVNLSRKNIWTSPDRALELMSTNLLSLLFFYTFILTWNAFLAILEPLAVLTMNFCHIFVYTSNYTQLKVERHFLPFLKHVIGGRTSCNKSEFFIYFELLCYFKLNFLDLFLEKKCFQISIKHFLKIEPHTFIFPRNGKNLSFP